MSPYAEPILFRLGEKVLMMSATILNKRGFCETLGIANDDVDFISIDSPFPKKNRPIFFCPIGKMSSSEIEKTLPKLAKAVESILERHKGEKGIIHAHSYRIANYLKKNLRNSRILIHDSSNREEVLKKHISSKKPTVLLSPSMTEGIDLKDDASRFQILCKVPYPYLGDKLVKKTSRKTLKLLGTVGEPINPEAWQWYYKVVGDSRCPIVDTWWQTETGGILISPQTGAINLKPGSATKPFYGIKPVIVDKTGKILKGEAQGRLCIAQSWPGQMRTVYGDHQRFIDTYFSQFDGKYFTGDGCRRDKDGYYWITGRVDDVIIVSGHNLGTAEIESAFVAHPKVAEAAVVGYPHDIKGNGLYCYVTLNAGEEHSLDLERELKLWVRKQIGPIATPDLIQFSPGLPKTRSGKIMRRILRKIAANEHDQLGDTTTLADPSVVKSLVENRKNI